MLICHMVLERLRRRRFIGGMTAAAAALAGCGDQAPSETPDRSGTRSMSASRRQDATGPAAIPPHDHSTSEAGGPVLHPERIAVSALELAPAFIVYHRDGAVRALDTRTQTEVHSSPDAADVIQQTIDGLSGGTIYIKRGVYEVGPREIALRSNVRLVGDGIGATILKLRDGIDGRRGERRSSVLTVGETVSNVTIADLEIDGNESGNRGVPPYPLSPHHHGILIHGSGPQVPEDRKPSNVMVRNVYVHDTVRSNIVLAGRNCTIENVRLENSATDHWLYLAGATNCEIRGVHASGFARAEGIVFGVGRRQCRGNLLSDLFISGITETPYQNDEPAGLGGRYPVRTIVFRPSGGNAFDNTVTNAVVSLPDAPVGQYFAVVQPNTRLENLRYRGPIGAGGIVQVNPRATGTTVQNAAIRLSEARRRVEAPVIEIHESDTMIKDVTIDDAGTTPRPAIVMAAPDAPVERVTIRDTVLAATGPALVVEGGDHAVIDIFVENVHDVNGTGVAARGDVDFLQRGVY